MWAIRRKTAQTHNQQVSRVSAPKLSLSCSRGDIICRIKHSPDSVPLSLFWDTDNRAMGGVGVQLLRISNGLVSSPKEFCFLR